MPYGTVVADVVQNTTGYSLGAGNASIMKNRIINGAMVIDQRNAGASVATSSGTNVFTLDRWQVYYTATNKYTVQQNAGSVTPPAGFTNYLGITSSAATTVGSTDLYLIYHRIEGFNCSDLGWGTANAKTVTLSFQVYSSLTGTFGGTLNSAIGTYSYPFTYSIATANTWTTISVTIAGPTAGTWGTGNSGCIQLNFTLGVGSTYNGTAGSWTANTYYGATGATSVVGTNGATFYITGVQLEVGSSATGYEYRQYGQELLLCQRYFETSADFGTNAQYAGQQIVVGVGTTSFGGSISFLQGKPFSVRKRVAPTVVLYYQDGSAGYVYRIDTAAKIAAVALYLNPAGFLYTYSASSAFNQGYGYYYSFTADAEL
jgi:hypothetical protein